MEMLFQKDRWYFIIKLNQHIPQILKNKAVFFATEKDLTISQHRLIQIFFHSFPNIRFGI